MIYDCFSFFNELDLLEIRLNTLDKVVDKFILAESPLTHSGSSKPLYYAENKERFAKFNDRITHIVVEDFPSFDGASPREMAWIRENWQRNAVMRGIPHDARDNDYIMISDLDEIPSPDAVTKAVAYNGVSRLFQTMFYYFLNYRNFTHPIWSLGTLILPLRMFREDCVPLDGDRPCFVDPRVNKGLTPTAARFLKTKHCIKNAGWHFSYCGGVSAVQTKLRAIAHTENDSPGNTDYNLIRKRIDAGKPPFISDDQFFAISLNNRFPKYIKEHKDRYSSMIFPVTASYIARTFLARLFESSKRISIEFLRLILPRSIRNWLYFHFIEPKQH